MFTSSVSETQGLQPKPGHSTQWSHTELQDCRSCRYIMAFHAFITQGGAGSFPNNEPIEPMGGKGLLRFMDDKAIQ